MSERGRKSLHSPQVQTGLRRGALVEIDGYQAGYRRFALCVGLAGMIIPTPKHLTELQNHSNIRKALTGLCGMYLTSTRQLGTPNIPEHKIGDLDLHW